MDFILVQSKWKNAVKYLNTKPGSAFESDHKCNTADIHFKIKNKNDPTVKYRKPNDQQLEKFNKCVEAKCTLEEGVHRESKFNRWAEIILEAAEETLAKMSPQQKQPYISEESWNMLEQKWQANEQGNNDEVHRLDKIIRNQIRKEKQDYRLAQLEEIDEAGCKWEGIKIIKKNSPPNSVNLKTNTVDTSP